jgi:glycosyltransferase involved in cell wall biosynthesis
MNIMIVAPMWLPIPAKTYGGTERIVHQLTNQLVDRGHQVTLFGHGQTVTKAQKLVSTYPRPLRDDGIEWTDINFDMIQGSKAILYAEQHQLDAIIFHSSWPHQLPFAAASKVPTLYVLHGVWSLDSYAKRHDKSEVDVLLAFKDQNFISLSLAQQKMVPGLNYIANIYNGLDLSELIYSPQGAGYAAWMGRMDIHKGPHLAIQVARKLGIKLKLAGPRRLEIASEKEFWTNHIEPFLGKDVEWVGDLDQKDKNAFLGQADVLLNPYVYNEAFGLVTLESLACGTPAVVPAWGGGPEIIESGVSGYIGSTVDEWTQAAKLALKLDRQDCRRRAEQFSVTRMAMGYEKAIKNLLNQKKDDPSLFTTFPSAVSSRPLNFARLDRSPSKQMKGKGSR